MKRLATTLTLLAATVVATTAFAGTIVFTGSESDFPVVDLKVDDGIDTQTFDCGFGPVDHPLDIGKVYITNDATKLYIGFQYQRFCFCDMQLGMAINTKAGGTTVDAFSHQIDWSLATDAPDYYIYDVIPTNCNGYNYEVLYRANGANGWNTVQDGSNGLGIVDTDGGNFVEIAIELVALELTGCGQSIGFEFWTTQEGNSRPAFDFVVNDNEQRSTPSGTCFDVGNPCGPSQPREYLPYTIECPPVGVENSTWSKVKALLQ